MTDQKHSKILYVSVNGSDISGNGSFDRPFYTGEGNSGDDAKTYSSPMCSAMTTEIMDLLAQAREGNDEATEEVLRRNSGLIWAVVRRYYGRGVENDDLYQLGCLGFLKAVRGFDTEYGTQFSTYAVPKIAGEIRRYLRDNGTIKVGRTVREQSFVIYSARDRLRFSLGREPSLSEISEATGMTVEEIAAAELATAAPDSLQQENADGLTLESTLADSVTEENMVEKIALRAAVKNLPEQEEKTILLRFFRGMTQQQCAKILGVSQVQVSRLEKRALEKLRKEMR